MTSPVRIWNNPYAPTRAQKSRAARPVTQADRALIAKAVEAGRITVCPTVHASSHHWGHATDERRIEPGEMRDLIRIQVSA